MKNKNSTPDNKNETTVCFVGEDGKINNVIYDNTKLNNLTEFFNNEYKNSEIYKKLSFDMDYTEPNLTFNDDLLIDENYNTYWKEILENKDGSINKEQLKKELMDFSLLIHNLSSLYCYITGNKASYPTTNVEIVQGLFEEELREVYDEGYENGYDDCIVDFRDND